MSFARIVKAFENVCTPPSTRQDLSHCTMLHMKGHKGFETINSVLLSLTTKSLALNDNKLWSSSDHRLSIVSPRMLWQTHKALLHAARFAAGGISDAKGHLYFSLEI